MTKLRQNVETLKKHLTNEEKEIRLKQEEFLRQLPSDKIKPPGWLKPKAKKIFKEIVNDLEPLGILANLDVMNLAVLADAFEKYIEATIALNTSTLTTFETNKNGSTKEVKNVYQLIQRDYAEVIKKFSADFGLNPASRQKLIDINLEPVDGEEKDFEDKYGV
jgi:P27 family predicted phage terminase small subunit